MIHHHLIVSGDTLWGIAQQYGSTVQTIARANSWLANIDLVQPGWVLHVPEVSAPVTPDPTPVDPDPEHPPHGPSDGALWSEQGHTGHVTITEDTVLDVDASVDSLTVAHGATLTFDQVSDITLESAGNIVVEGVLSMCPHGVEHTIRFVGVDEGAYVGGGDHVLDTDVGMWVMHHGRLDVCGDAKTAWTRAEAIDAGSTTITLLEAPTGWREGDELAVTPTARGSFDGYSSVTVARVDGATITVTPTQRAHPTVEIAPGQHLGAEVLNLTRNARIEGTPDGRAHVFVHAHAVQSIRYVAVRHMGPRQPDGSFTRLVAGRYPIHIHMGGDDTRGSLIEGTVVRDCGSHAYVVHASHGVTHRACISHNTMANAYWWDPAPHRTNPVNDTHDTVYDRCVASLVRHDPDWRGWRLTGFSLGDGTGNEMFDCVSVGVSGASFSSGFHWPESLREGVWGFRRCVAHNNRSNGIFTWQNSDGVHIVEDFVAYHNGKAGIEHGAYTNRYVYRNCWLIDSPTGVIMHSLGKTSPFQQWNAIHSRCVAGMRILDHTLPAGGPIIVAGCVFSGHDGPAVQWSNNGAVAEWFEFRDCVADGVLLGPVPDTVPPSNVTFDDTPTGTRPTSVVLVRSA